MTGELTGEQAAVVGFVVGTAAGGVGGGRDGDVVARLQRHVAGAGDVRAAHAQVVPGVHRHRVARHRAALLGGAGAARIAADAAVGQESMALAVHLRAAALRQRQRAYVQVVRRLAQQK